VIVVHGKNPFAFYSTNPGGGEGPAILAEITAYINANPSPYYGAHSQIITPAFGYNPTTGIVDEQVPVYGSGRNCYSLDYPDLRWSLLGTGGVLGTAATVNIGGTAHEMGHGLNLSHNKTKVSETALGTALMSDGNYTFGASTTSLTAADAAILNRNQVFNDGSISYYGPAHASISIVHACFSISKNAIIAAGRITNNGSPVTDVAIYNDPNNGSSPGMGDNKDYDAPTWTAPIIGTDSFYIEIPITELQVNDSSLYEMKVRLIQQDGNTTDTKYYYDFANNIPHLTDPAFVPISATITASAGANGTISSSGVTTLNCVENKTYTFTPNPGYAVMEVLVDGVSQGALPSYTFSNVTISHTISVSFSSTLPVNLVSFTVTLQGKNNALLQWSTASELNNKGYDIEMSQNNTSYNKMGFVQGKGTSSNLNTYENIVAGLAPGTYYFRLKIIDVDGHFTYSPVRMVKITNVADLITIYPNPSKDGFVFIDLKEMTNNVTLQVTNALGQLVSTNKYANYSSPLRVRLPAPGVYNIWIITADGNTIVRKLISLQ
jgi:hypothetical protein